MEWNGGGLRLFSSNGRTSIPREYQEPEKIPVRELVATNRSLSSAMKKSFKFYE
jgi:hypothetical protein